MNAVSRTGNIFEDVAIKAPVRLASTVSNLTLSGLQTIDGLAGADGDRVLLAAQSDETQNGIWQMTTGAWQRTADGRQNTDFIDGTLVPVARGTAHAGKMFVLQTADSPVVIDTSELTFFAQSEVLAAQQSATSASSVAIGTGAKSFTIQSGKAFVAGQYVLAYQTSNPDNVMLGKIGSYVGTALALTVVSTGGSGTITDWTIVLANSAAAAGRVPPTGTGNTTGPGSSVAGNLPRFADTTGKVLEDSGKPAGTLAGRNALLYGDAGTAAIPEASLVPGAAPLPYTPAQPAENLRLVNDVSNPNRDINITAGRWRDDTDVANLFLAGTMVKRLDQAWAAGGASGSPVGGCDTGSKGAGQTWHTFLIGKRNLAVTAFSRTSNVATITVAAHGAGAGGSLRAFGMGSGMDAIAAITAVATNTISYANSGADIPLTSVTAVADVFDVLASQTYSGPTMPSGWTVKQCLGSFLTDGSGNLRAMTHVGDEFLLGAAVAASPSFSTTAGLIAVAAPAGVKTVALLRGQITWSIAQSGSILITSPDETDQTPTASNSQFSGSGGLTGAVQGASFACRTDTSSQVRGRASAAFNTASIAGYGWRDPRRRLF